MEASRSAGYSNTQSVTFGEMKLEDQMRAAYCTDVLVGIQGTCIMPTKHDIQELDVKL